MVTGTHEIRQLFLFLRIGECSTYGTEINIRQSNSMPVFIVTAVAKFRLQLCIFVQLKGVCCAANQDASTELSGHAPWPVSCFWLQFIHCQPNIPEVCIPSIAIILITGTRAERRHPAAQRLN